MPQKLLQRKAHVCFYFLFKLTFLNFLFLTTGNASNKAPKPMKFTVYAFLPWKNQKSDIHEQLSKYMENFGIMPIKVIYEKDFFTQGKPDLQKIKKVAETTKLEPNIPVSFDFEFGNRFKPETVIPDVEIILHNYHAYHSKAFVGIYGVIPQNTYAWKTTISAYDRLNDSYKTLVKLVDFLSPVLYNYDGTNFTSWLKTAEYNMNAAKQYASNKPILPFLSPVVRIGRTHKIKNGHIVEELDERAMKKRLGAVFNLGASGCIIWASSQDRKKDGQFPTFDPEQGWGKAVVEFIKTH